jgi:DNA-binding CsgD family transcriptional regulator
MAEHMGDEELTTRETEVLGQLAAGHRTREIGERLFISEDTVKVHVKHILHKIGARDRTHAIAIAYVRWLARETRPFHAYSGSLVLLRTPVKPRTLDPRSAAESMCRARKSLVLTAGTDEPID